MRMLLAAVAVVIGVVGGVITQSNTDAANRSVQLLWMSSVSRLDGSVERFCTGIFNPPYHGQQATNMYLDVMIGTSVATICTTPPSTSASANLRTWGFSSVTHGTIATLSGSGEFTGGCDYIDLGMIDAKNLLIGTARFIHARGTSGVVRGIWAGPSPYGYVTNSNIGSTVGDSNCSWSGHHVHQGFTITCPDKNGTMAPSQKNDVWGLFDWVHQMVYTEGQSGC